MDPSSWSHRWLLLLILALSACAGPLPAPGAATASIPTTTATAPALSHTPTRSPGPTATPSPPPTLTILPPSPTPTAFAPLSQILPQISPHALLYSLGRGSLIIADLNQPRRWIALNPGRCAEQRSARAYGSWSGDGRFIAFICTDQQPNQLYLITLQTAEVRPIDRAHVIAASWSFRDSHLLITTVSPGADDTINRHTYLLDAATGDRVELPVTATFEEIGYGGFGSLAYDTHGYVACVAWSPDGTRLAVVGTNDIYVVDADGRNGRSFPQASDPAFFSDQDWKDGGMFRFRPVWSADGQTLYVSRLVLFKRFTTPSGSISSRAVAITIASGAVQHAESVPNVHEPPEGSRAWQYVDARSPDGAFAVQSGTDVVNAQGQVQLTIYSMQFFMGWRPMP
jgi:hypothetical protein